MRAGACVAIYLLKGSSLHIVQAAPADAMAEVGRVEIEGYASSFHLAGDRIVALSSLSGAPKTLVSLIDVANRSQPVVQQTWQFDAVQTTSRLIGGHLHLVLTSPRQLRQDKLEAHPLGIA